MSYAIGIDVGGTFTDFVAGRRGRRRPARSTRRRARPSDPSRGVLTGSARSPRCWSLAERVPRAVDADRPRHDRDHERRPDRATARATGLLTTEGFRDILEMRRGVRSRTPPLRQQVQRRRRRSCRATCASRCRARRRPRARCGRRSTRAVADARRGALLGDGRRGDRRLLHALLRQRRRTSSARAEIVERARAGRLPVGLVGDPAAGPAQRAGRDDGDERLRRPGAAALPRAPGRARSAQPSFGGDAAGDAVERRRRDARRSSPAIPATTVLSGPGRRAGRRRSPTRAAAASDDCIVVDMGGTSFDASIVKDGEVQVTRQGEIDRHADRAADDRRAHDRRRRRLDRLARRRRPAAHGPAERGRRARARLPTAAAAPSRPAPTPTSCSATSTPTTSSAAGCASTSTLAREAIRASASPGRSASSVVERRRGDGRGDRPRRWPRARRTSRSSAATTRASCRWSSPAARAPCTRARSPTSWRSRRSIVPRLSSVLCALGMLLADLRHDYARAPRALGGARRRRGARRCVDELARAGRRGARAGGRRRRRAARVVAAADIRYVGQHHEVTVAFPPDDLGADASSGSRRRFHRRHEELYGFASPGRPMEIVGLHATVLGRGSAPRSSSPTRRTRRGAAPRRGRARSTCRSTRRSRRSRCSTATGWRRASRCAGPGVVEHANDHDRRPRGFDARRRRARQLRPAAAGGRARHERSDDPILTSVIANRLKAIGERMGVVVERSARSPLLVEGRDFSLGIYDATASCSSRPSTSRCSATRPRRGCGASPSTSATTSPRATSSSTTTPTRGGNQLSDWKVAKPVFHEGEHFAWVVIAAHQADVGGAVPGSYNPNATDMWQEGLRITPLKLYDGGERRAGRLGLRLRQRAPADRRRRRHRDDRRLHGRRARAEGRCWPRYGRDGVRRRLAAPARRRRAERARAVVARIADGTYRAEWYVHDDGIDHDGQLDDPARGDGRRRRDHLRLLGDRRAGDRLRQRAAGGDALLGDDRLLHDRRGGAAPQRRDHAAWSRWSPARGSIVHPALPGADRLRQPPLRPDRGGDHAGALRRRCPSA